MQTVYQLLSDVTFVGGVAILWVAVSSIILLSAAYCYARSFVHGAVRDVQRLTSGLGEYPPRVRVAQSLNERFMELQSMLYRKSSDAEIASFARDLVHDMEEHSAFTELVFEWLRAHRPHLITPDGDIRVL